ncbi:MAG TPA: NAD-dependent succinate-semialdehyde dehydrogenase [Candidatus Eisenbacteria bacterium]|jgi:succinate-semialdehyde dehydrogenase/glutarate-semialdehyde dehydrogenase|nr:NAD-dependent succinate-semialdehyde dehydrogenase [Candidatus Eisenbacteria bacterium]
MLVSIDPATGKKLREYPETDASKIASALELADHTARAWRDRSFGERGAVVRRAAAILRERSAEFAKLMADEMGKPLAQGRSECEKCAWVCDHFAASAESMLAPEPVATEAERSYIAYVPLGVVLAVMPWNFPFWQVFRFAAPTLMAGNVGVLKHASNVSGCALAIEALLCEAGLPEGAFTTLLVGSAAVEGLIASPHVRAVTLTGSTPAGRAVASAAGRALKKSVLELGGSDPYLVLEDADLDLAVETCAAARLVNTGQSCIAAKRFIVVEGIRAAFTERFVARMRRAKLGDPRDPGVDLGPLARRDLRDQLHGQVVASVERGANVLLGGEVPAGPGAFYPPTVLADVRPGMPAYSEELFGPVASVIAARDEKDAIRIANDSSFGLGASVFTRDKARGERIAREELEAGSCFVNAQVHSDPRLPFGGIKESGYGRELAAFGAREFTNVKTVFVK